MVKLKWLKSYQGSVVGENFNANKKSAENFVAQGYAESFKKNQDKENKKETKEEKPKRKVTDDELKQLVSLKPIKQEEVMEKISEETGVKVTTIKAEVILLVKEIKYKEKAQKKEEERKENAKGTYFQNEDGSIKKLLPMKLEVLSFLNRKEFGPASEILVEAVMMNNHIYTTKEDKASEMWIYQDGIYIPNGEVCIKEQLREVMQENYSDWLANQVLAKIRTDTFIESEKFFKEKDMELYEIAVENGILDLKELTLYKFDPKKIFFSKIPVYYNEEATCPKIEEFLTDILKEEDDINVFYELAGFGLVKEYFMEKAFMFVGNGRNGKGKSIELLKRLIGTRNTASVPLSAITSSSPFVEKLWKRHFNLAGDISSADLKETGMFKQLTGRDPISANRKYKNIIEFTNYAKMVFACNELPKVYDYSDGFWDRWILLEFPFKFVEQYVFDRADEKERKNWKIRDETIIDQITGSEEMSGFLNMALAGLHRLFNNHRFSYSTGTDEVKNKWIRMSDSFMAFCMDSVEEDYESKITKKDVRQHYKKYCTEHRLKGVSDLAIKRTLQEMFGVVDDFTKMHEFGNQEHCWVGIKFKEKNTLIRV